jgi:hypothetical protein
MSLLDLGRFDVGNEGRRFLLFCAVSFLMSIPAMATTVVYDNGPINGTQGSGAPTISGGAVTDSFLLSSDSIITGTANIGLWLDHNNAPSSVNWSITSSPYSGVLASGTAAWNSTFLFTNAFNFDIYSGSFSIPDLLLVSGTYWLQLDTASTTPAGTTFWDRSDGPSQAFDGPGITDPAGSESFQILGTTPVAGVPEPASLLLVASALAVIVPRSRRYLRNPKS